MLLLKIHLITFWIGLVVIAAATLLLLLRLLNAQLQSFGSELRMADGPLQERQDHSGQVTAARIRDSHQQRPEAPSDPGTERDARSSVVVTSGSYSAKASDTRLRLLGETVSRGPGHDSARTGGEVFESNSSTDPLVSAPESPPMRGGRAPVRSLPHRLIGPHEGVGHHTASHQDLRDTARDMVPTVGSTGRNRTGATVADTTEGSDTRRIDVEVVRRTEEHSLQAGERPAIPDDFRISEHSRRQPQGADDAKKMSPRDCNGYILEGIYFRIFNLRKGSSLTRPQ